MTALTELREDRPVALIVEDVQSMLDTRKNNFTRKGFLAIGVSSKAEALRELRSAPAIDIVVTDIGLNAIEPEKDSGVDLLHDVRSFRSDLPVVGYSARDLDDALTNAPFNDFLPKEEALRMEQKIGEWYDLAMKYRISRITTARKQLERLQADYRISSHDIQIFRDFLPGSHLPLSDPESTPETADELLRQAGYRLGIIEAQTTVPESGPPQVKIGIPICVWLREVEGAIVAELHGHPAIYGEGIFQDSPLAILKAQHELQQKRAEQEAINQVLDLMYGYHCDFQANAILSDFPEEIKALREFLDKVFV